MRISPAQQLPMNVLGTIIKILVNHKTSPFRGVTYWPHNLKELLYVCASWRQMALACLWRRLQLTIDDKAEDIRLSRPTWVTNNALPHAAHLARELRVHVSMSGIISGTSCRLLTEYMGSTKRLPIVNKLYVTINDFKNDFQGSKESAISSTIEFSRVLKSLVPETAAVKLTCLSEDVLMAMDETEIEDLDETYISVLTSSLYKDVKNAMFNLSDVYLKTQSAADTIPILTSLELNFLRSPAFQTSLVIKSAPVLQYLSIEISNASTLIYDGSGNNVVYPNLQYLQMSYCDQKYHGVEEAANDLVVFPVLKYAKLVSVYPFADDVLFRGNNATLSYLSIPLDKSTVEMLYRCRIFESNRAALQSVVLRVNFGNEDLSLVSETIMSKFLSSVSRSALYLSLPSDLLTSLLIGAQYRDCFKNVQVLDICSSALTFYDVLCLLKVLPTLTSLRCSIGSLGSELEHIMEEKIPDHIASTYGGIGKSLQTWCTSDHYDQPGSDLLQYILLLALVCPRFCRADTHIGTIPDYNHSLAAALQSGPYSTYASQLSRLFTHKVK